MIASSTHDDSDEFAGGQGVVEFKLRCFAWGKRITQQEHGEYYIRRLITCFR